jgi:hypothetical protein
MDASENLACNAERNSLAKNRKSSLRVLMTIVLVAIERESDRTAVSLFPCASPLHPEFYPTPSNNTVEI